MYFSDTVLDVTKEDAIGNKTFLENNYSKMLAMIVYLVQYSVWKIDSLNVF